MDFDINDLDMEVKQALVDQIEAASQEFYQHREKANAQLLQGEETNRNSLTLQNQTVALRIDQNKNITSALQESKVSLNNLDQQNQQKQGLRDTLQEMQAKLRRMEINIQSAEIENENMKNVQQFE